MTDVENRPSRSNLRPGISGFAVHVPPLRVDLEDWCAWTGANWQKVSKIAGRAFRMLSPVESPYTLAAEAVLKLIRQYDIDPGSVGMLALGTESSTDNSAGAVIVRGLVDQALVAAGLPRLSSTCEVPELKHACLGGVYALKTAARYVAFDGADRCAIVVSVDVAEYERGSSGEQTQGAGAVAMWVEADPRLLEIDLHRSGSASNYRGPDFRKPARRFFMDGYDNGRLHDFPVFNGRYSTYCYLDSTARAVDAMLARLDTDFDSLLDDSRAVFFHRPYHHMPVSTLGALTVRGMARNPASRDALCELAREAGVTLEQIDAELDTAPDLFVTRRNADELARDPTPALSAVARLVRRTDAFRERLATRMDLGTEAMKACGNMYTAALPAWLAAGFEDALQRGEDLAGEQFVAIGYGSGDAAEAIPCRVVSGWAQAAGRIGFADALAGGVDLTQAQYEALHDGQAPSELASWPDQGFVVAELGADHETAFQDIGIEYFDRRSA